MMRPESKVLNSLLQSGLSLEEALSALRQQGYSKGQACIALAEVRSLDLGDAQLPVHHSTTWADRKEQDEHFNQAFWDAVDALPRQPDGSIALSDLCERTDNPLA
jgi:hypothetical protein